MSVDLCRQSLSGGVVPYLGTYLTVLMMLDTALTDTVEVSARHRPQATASITELRIVRVYLNLTWVVVLFAGRTY